MLWFSSVFSGRRIHLRLRLLRRCFHLHTEFFCACRYIVRLTGRLELALPAVNFGKDLIDLVTPKRKCDAGVFSSA